MSGVMIRSMTAFVRTVASPREKSWVVEIRSLNHRYFEFSMKSPAVLFPLENRIRELVQQKMKRGKITLSITQNSESEDGAQLKLNEKAVQRYLDAVSKLQKRFKLKMDLSAQEVLRLPEIFEVERATEEDAEKIWPQLEKALKRALESAIHAKEREGKKLGADVTERLTQIEKAVHQIENHTKDREGRYFKKLSERVGQILQEQALDAERVYREVAFLAERSDITEEIVRIKSHLNLFRSRLHGSSEIGRELDFLCQEMFREINTMGAKAQFFEISRQTVFVKGELEKIREQVQNIE
ncbi:MAG: YicC family protein [Candidatus Omnitrophica bacterium]|nr:YicC family protein [Candidatus Omnitrophota bacterium]